VLEKEPLAANIEVTNDALTVHLTDGRTLTVPLHWYPRLSHASIDERNHWQLLGDGYAIDRNVALTDLKTRVTGLSEQKQQKR
jgi:hypothetical protein